jgi:hypothetical protein
MIEEWCELPLWRRHCYVYVCLLLLVLASRGVIDAVGAQLQVKPVAKAIQSKEQRIGNTDLSDWLSPNEH